MSQPTKRILVVNVKPRAVYLQRSDDPKDTIIFTPRGRRVLEFTDAQFQMLLLQ